MQTLDNAIALRPKRKRSGEVRLQTEQDPERPNPIFIPVANQAAEWLAERTGGIAQSAITEAMLNVPTTAHILGGAVIGHDPEGGVVDSRQRVFGYENLMVCDGAAMPANVGVNPSLTITALAEHAMAGPAQRRSRAAPLPEAARPAARRLSSALLGEALRYVVPVDDVPEGVDVVGAFVLVLEVVGVLPDVAAEQRRCCRRRPASPGSAVETTARPELSLTSQAQPEPKRAMPAFLNSSLKASKEPKVSSIAAPARRSARRRRRG